MKEFIINKNDSGQRLDKFISKTVKSLPQTLMYKYIRLKRIKVNSKRADIKYVLNTGDIVQMYINDEFFGVSEPKPFLKVKPNLNIIYEDENIIIVNKSKGLIVHSDDNENYNTLINHILAYLIEKNEYDYKNENSFVPALCNRIDKNTEGIVLAAKNAESLRILNEKIKKREISKFYLCLANGKFNKKSDVLSDYLIKNNNTNTVKIYKNKLPGSKSVITKYNVISYIKDVSLVEIELVTGRTHQIRAHMAYYSHPLIGDGKYGKNDIFINKKMYSQCLCAYKIKFNFEDENEHILSYLNNKTFEIDKNSISFVNLYNSL